jgi:hypothetical protein
VNIQISGNVKQYVAGGPNTNLSGVTITLTSSGGPIAPESPEAIGLTTTTDASGNYAFNGIFSGNYTVTPSLSGKAFDPISRSLTGVTANITNADFVAYTVPGGLPRDLKAVNTYVTPGQPAAMPVMLTSLGGETTVSFSLNYDTNTAGIPTVTCGAAAPGCTVTANTATNGKVGVTVIPAVAYTAGQREVAKVTFPTVPTIQPNAAVTFGDAPVTRAILDGGGNPLSSTYTNGFIVYSQNLEGDLSNRNTGNGVVDSTDLTILRQIATGSLTPDPAYNEFQRADVSPSATKGDGQVDSTDVAQERQYAAGNAAAPHADGPYVGTVVPIGPIAPPANSATRRAMHIGSTSTSNGNRITIPVELTAQGDETAASFTLNFDSSRLQNPSVELGTGANTDTVLTSNTARSAEGRVTVLVDGSGTLAAQLVNVTFDVAATAASGDTHISFANDPTPSVVSNANGQKLDTSYENGTVTISGPNSTGLSISGRVLTPDGRGLRNASVTIVDQSGMARTVTTSSFGYYTIDGVSQGGTYTLAVSSRTYRFAPRTVQATDNLTDVDFTGQE